MFGPKWSQMFSVHNLTLMKINEYLFRLQSNSEQQDLLSGLILGLTKEIFRVAAADTECSIQLKVQYYQIYNEKIYDLLEVL